MSYNTTVELNKDNAFNMDIHISHVEFLGYDAIFFMVDPYTLDPIDEFVLEDFVPEDYNVFEHIRGGHETPNYTTETSEDYSVEDWWSELTDKDAKINEHVESSIPLALKLVMDELGYKSNLKVNINIII